MEGRRGRGSTVKSSSVACVASVLVVSRENGCAGRHTPRRTGASRESAVWISSAIAIVQSD